MADYSEDIAMALELIEEDGEQVVWQKVTTQLADPDQPWLGGGDSAPVNHTPFIVFVPATDGASGFGISKFRQGEEQTAFSTFGLMGAQDFDPQTTDVVLRGGQPLVIKSIDTLKPAEQVVLYILSIV
jgi:hypothetical protein